MGNDSYDNNIFEDTSSKRKQRHFGTLEVKRGFAQMLKNGVIMDVINAEQARIAENAGAVAVMALEKVPADIRKEGGVARMAQPDRIKEIIDAVSIPVMAKVRIGHYGEADIEQLIAGGIDCIDESEVLTPADNEYHIDKNRYKVPFVCGARNLGEALRRIEEGAAMIRTKGEAGTGDINQAVYHIRTMRREISLLVGCNEVERYLKRKEKASESYKNSNISEDIKGFIRWLKTGKSSSFKSSSFKSSSFAGINPDFSIEIFLNIIGMLKLSDYYERRNILPLDDELLGFFRDNKLPIEFLNKSKGEIKRASGIDKIIGQFIDSYFTTCAADKEIDNMSEKEALKGNMLKYAQNSLSEKALEYGVTEELVRQIADICYEQRFNTLPVVNFAAGGIATPADAILMMKLGADGIFIGSGIFKSENPEARARAIVSATTCWETPETALNEWRGLGGEMPGISSAELSEENKMQKRGE